MFPRFLGGYPHDHMSTPQHPDRWRALAVTLLVGFMSLLDVTIVNVAVPSMQQGLHASSESIRWIVSGYALAFGLTLVAGGRLGGAAAGLSPKRCSACRWWCRGSRRSPCWSR